MSKKGTLVLVALLVALCAGYWLMLEVEKRGAREEIRSRKLFDFAPEDVRTIEISRMGEATVSAERGESGAWAITKPNPSIEANQVVWDRAAKAIATLDNARTLDGGADMAGYGLDKPVLTVVASRQGGESLRFEFGAIEPTQSYRYARLDGNLVFLADVKQFHEMDRSLDLLRDRRLLKVGDEGITRLEYSRFRTPKNLSGDVSQQPATEESVVMAVEKQPDGHWQVVSPENVPANQELVDGLIREIQYNMPSGYVDSPESLEDYGLDRPVARLTVYAGVGSEPQVILIGAKRDQENDAGGVWGKIASKPAVFLMDPNILVALPKTPEAFREGRLFTRQAAKLRSLHYTSGDVDLLIENDPAKGWRLAQPLNEDTDQMAVSNFISLLKNLSGRSFPPGASDNYGFDKPTLAIRFEFAEGEPGEILVGAAVPDVGMFYARQDNGVAIMLTDLEVAAMKRTAADFERKTLMEFEKNAARKVAITLDGVEYEFELLRGRWAVVKPEGRSFTTARDMDPLINTLSSLRAAKKVADDPNQVKEAGMDAPVAVITVTAGGDGEEPKTLGPVKIGAATVEESQHRYATSDSRLGLYLVGQAVVDEIRDTVKALRKQ